MLVQRLARRIALFFGMMIFSSFGVSAFNDITHKYVAKTSFEAFSENTLVNDNSESSNISEDFKKAVSFYRDDEKDYKELFVRFSIQPDIDETQGIYKYHFYNPITETNFMNEKESALTKFKEHFKKAVSFYRDGEKEDSYKELGRAVHFMEDMNTPVHTAYEMPSDSVLKLRLHVDFEKVCDQVCEECSLEIIPESLGYYAVNSLDSISRSSSTLAADNFYYLESKKEDEETLAKYAVSNAQRKVSGILYRFFKEVTNQ